MNKPGYKTTEFWVSILGFLFLTFKDKLGLGSVDQGSIDSLTGQIASGIVGAIVLAGYAISRGKAKGQPPGQ
jgi:hypothetical protein